MSSFKNRSSKERAESSLNKLLSSMMPSSGTVTSTTKRNGRGSGKHGTTSIQSLNEAFNNMDSRTKNNIDDVIEKRMKKSRKKQIKRNKIINEEVNKVAKLQIIKKQVEAVKKSNGSTRYERPDYELSSDEKKFMNSLISKNVKTLKSYSGNRGGDSAQSPSDDEDEDDDIREEILRLQEDVLAIKTKKDKRVAVKKAKGGQERKRGMEFSSEKIINGKKVRVHAYPGLTPGLAPVDLDDDDEESD